MIWSTVKRAFMLQASEICVVSSILTIFCLLLGLSFGPMHTMLGCLLVGLGVDDAFVIVQEFNNAEENDKKNNIQNRTLEERIGRGMKQAGAGITVTSMTDIIVFAIGTKHALKIYDT